MLSRTGLKSKGAGANDFRKGTGNNEADEAARLERPGELDQRPVKTGVGGAASTVRGCILLQKGGGGSDPHSAGEAVQKVHHQRGRQHLAISYSGGSTSQQSAVASNQARWSLDVEEIDYLGVKLRMGHISQLVFSEYRRARTLLYGELSFGAVDMDIAPVEAWRVHDDLDAEDYGGSWLSDVRNEESLQGTQDALLRQIEQRADLRRAFVRDEDGGCDYNDHNDDDDDVGGNGGIGSNGGSGGWRRIKRLRWQAMTVYESRVQDFLRLMDKLIQVPPAPPLRAPELLSVTYANRGSRRRSILREKMVMIHVRFWRLLYGYR